MQPIKANGYPILFGEKGYEFLNIFIEENNYSNIFILTDNNSNAYCFTRFSSFLAANKAIKMIEIKAGESEKNINTCVDIWNILTKFEGDRKSVLINVGGGVITDIGGFVASTFKRGIDFIHIPTTLLAMVDASVGGKNGVDLGNLKNQIGVINLPKIVLVDTEYLRTLPQNEMRSGFAEMLKHGLIFDANYWNLLKELNQTDFNDLDSLIYLSVAIKNKIVMEDPTENGIRKSLNFGHTLGHAIESYFLESETKKTLLHGEAIAVGMILESFISWKKKLLSEKEYCEIKNVINNIYETIVFEEKDIQPILDLLIHDKKNEYGKIQFALLNGIGNIKINQEVENEIIIKSFNDYKI